MGMPFFFQNVQLEMGKLEITFHQVHVVKTAYVFQTVNAQVRAFLSFEQQMLLIAFKYTAKSIKN